MKSINNILALSILLFFTYQGNLYAATYTSLTSGLWNDATNVWSLDGVTPCGCSPSTTTAGNNIVINHTITTTANLIVNGGSSFRVNPTGQLLGSDNINTWNSAIDFFGHVAINKFVMDAGAMVTLHTGVIMDLNNQLQIINGVFTNDGGLSNSGGIDIHSTGTLTLLNASRTHVTSGNMTNFGVINICATCCMSSNGNWRNMATGIVTGNGAVNSGGNVNNSGVWDVNVSWCANGAGLGLPIPEDCATSQAICFAITLPVELINLAAEAIDNEFVDITWETASEQNSDYFSVERSIDGKEWITLGQAKAAGNSDEAINYLFTDTDPNTGTNYYRLVQVDFNGRTATSETVAAEIIRTGQEMTAYPNPIANGQVLTVKGVNYGDQLVLLNAAGNTIVQETVESHSGIGRITIEQVDGGMYFVRNLSTDAKPIKITILR